MRTTFPNAFVSLNSPLTPESCHTIIGAPESTSCTAIQQVRRCTSVLSSSPTVRFQLYGKIEPQEEPRQLFCRSCTCLPRPRWWSGGRVTGVKVGLGALVRPCVLLGSSLFSGLATTTRNPCCSSSSSTAHCEARRGLWVSATGPSSTPRAAGSGRQVLPTLRQPSSKGVASTRKPLSLAAGSASNIKPSALPTSAKAAHSTAVSHINRRESSRLCSTRSPATCPSSIPPSAALLEQLWVWSEGDETSSTAFFTVSRSSAPPHSTAKGNTWKDAPLDESGREVSLEAVSQQRLQEVWQCLLWWQYRVQRCILLRQVPSSLIQAPSLGPFMGPFASNAMAEWTGTSALPPAAVLTAVYRETHSKVQKEVRQTLQWLRTHALKAVPFSLSTASAQLLLVSLLDECAIWFLYCLYASSATGNWLQLQQEQTSAKGRRRNEASESNLDVTPQGVLPSDTLRALLLPELTTLSSSFPLSSAALSSLNSGSNSSEGSFSSVSATCGGSGSNRAGGWTGMRDAEMALEWLLELSEATVESADRTDGTAKHKGQSEKTSCRPSARPLVLLGLLHQVLSQGQGCSLLSFRALLHQRKREKHQSSSACMTPQKSETVGYVSSLPLHWYGLYCLSRKGSNRFFATHVSDLLPQWIKASVEEFCLLPSTAKYDLSALLTTLPLPSCAAMDEGVRTTDGQLCSPSSSVFQFPFYGDLLSDVGRTLYDNNGTTVGPLSSLSPLSTPHLYPFTLSRRTLPLYGTSSGRVWDALHCFVPYWRQMLLIYDQVLSEGCQLCVASAQELQQLSAAPSSLSRSALRKDHPRRNAHSREPSHAPSPLQSRIDQTLKTCVGVLIAIRRMLSSQPQPHQSHSSLRIRSNATTTSSTPSGEVMTNAQDTNALLGTRSAAPVYIEPLLALYEAFIQPFPRGESASSGPAAEGSSSLRCGCWSYWRAELLYGNCGFLSPSGGERDLESAAGTLNAPSSGQGKSSTLSKRNTRSSAASRRPMRSNAELWLWREAVQLDVFLLLAIAHASEKAVDLQQWKARRSLRNLQNHHEHVRKKAEGERRCLSNASCPTTTLSGASRNPTPERSSEAAAEETKDWGARCASITLELFAECAQHWETVQAIMALQAAPPPPSSSSSYTTTRARSSSSNAATDEKIPSARETTPPPVPPKELPRMVFRERLASFLSRSTLQQLLTRCEEALRLSAKIFLVFAEDHVREGPRVKRFLETFLGMEAGGETSKNATVQVMRRSLTMDASSLDVPSAHTHHCSTRGVGAEQQKVLSFLRESMDFALLFGELGLWSKSLSCCEGLLGKRLTFDDAAALRSSATEEAVKANDHGERRTQGVPSGTSEAVSGVMAVHRLLHSSRFQRHLSQSIRLAAREELLTLLLPHSRSADVPPSTFRGIPTDRNVEMDDTALEAVLQKVSEWCTVFLQERLRPGAAECLMPPAVIVELTFRGSLDALTALHSHPFLPCQTMSAPDHLSSPTSSLPAQKNMHRENVGPKPGPDDGRTDKVLSQPFSIRHHLLPCWTALRLLEVYTDGEPFAPLRVAMRHTDQKEVTCTSVVPPLLTRTVKFFLEAVLHFLDDFRTEQGGAAPTTSPDPIAPRSAFTQGSAVSFYQYYQFREWHDQHRESATLAASHPNTFSCSALSEGKRDEKTDLHSPGPMEAFGLWNAEAMACIETFQRSLQSYLSQLLWRYPQLPIASVVLSTWLCTPPSVSSPLSDDPDRSAVRAEAEHEMSKENRSWDTQSCSDLDLTLASAMQWRATMQERLKEETAKKRRVRARLTPSSHPFSLRQGSEPKEDTDADGCSSTSSSTTLLTYGWTSREGSRRWYWGHQALTWLEVVYQSATTAVSSCTPPSLSHPIPLNGFPLHSATRKKKRYDVVAGAHHSSHSEKIQQLAVGAKRGCPAAPQPTLDQEEATSTYDWDGGDAMNWSSSLHWSFLNEGLMWEGVPRHLLLRLQRLIWSSVRLSSDALTSASTLPSVAQSLSDKRNATLETASGDGALTDPHFQMPYRTTVLKKAGDERPEQLWKPQGHPHQEHTTARPPSVSSSLPWQANMSSPSRCLWYATQWRQWLSWIQAALLDPPPARLEEQRAQTRLLATEAAANGFPVAMKSSSSDDADEKRSSSSVSPPSPLCFSGNSSFLSVETLTAARYPFLFPAYPPFARASVSRCHLPWRCPYCWYWNGTSLERSTVWSSRASFGEEDEPLGSQSTSLLTRNAEKNSEREWKSAAAGECCVCCGTSHSGWLLCRTCTQLTPLPRSLREWQTLATEKALQWYQEAPACVHTDGETSLEVNCVFCQAPLCRIQSRLQEHPKKGRRTSLEGVVGCARGVPSHHHHQQQQEQQQTGSCDAEPPTPPSTVENVKERCTEQISVWSDGTSPLRVREAHPSVEGRTGSETEGTAAVQSEHGKPLAAGGESGAERIGDGLILQVNPQQVCRLWWWSSWQCAVCGHTTRSPQHFRTANVRITTGIQREQPPPQEQEQEEERESHHHSRWRMPPRLSCSQCHALPPLPSLSPSAASPFSSAPSLYPPTDREATAEVTTSSITGRTGQHPPPQFWHLLPYDTVHLHLDRHGHPTDAKALRLLDATLQLEQQLTPSSRNSLRDNTFAGAPSESSPPVSTRHSPHAATTYRCSCCGMRAPGAALFTLGVSGVHRPWCVFCGAVMRPHFLHCLGVEVWRDGQALRPDSSFRSECWECVECGRSNLWYEPTCHACGLERVECFARRYRGYRWSRREPSRLPMSGLSNLDAVKGSTESHLSFSTLAGVSATALKPSSSSLTPAFRCCCCDAPSSPLQRRCWQCGISHAAAVLHRSPECVAMGLPLPLKPMTAVSSTLMCLPTLQGPSPPPLIPWYCLQPSCHLHLNWSYVHAVKKRRRSEVAVDPASGGPEWCGDGAVCEGCGVPFGLPAPQDGVSPLAVHRLLVSEALRRELQWWQPPTADTDHEAGPRNRKTAWRALHPLAFPLQEETALGNSRKSDMTDSAPMNERWKTEMVSRDAEAWHCTVDTAATPPRVAVPLAVVLPSTVAWGIVSPFLPRRVPLLATSPSTLLGPAASTANPVCQRCGAVMAFYAKNDRVRRDQMSKAAESDDDTPSGEPLLSHSSSPNPSAKVWKHLENVLMRCPACGHCNYPAAPEDELGSSSSLPNASYPTDAYWLSRMIVQSLVELWSAPPHSDNSNWTSSEMTASHKNGLHCVEMLSGVREGGALLQWWQDVETLESLLELLQSSIPLEALPWRGVDNRSTAAAFTDAVPKEKEDVSPTRGEAVASRLGAATTPFSNSSSSRSSSSSTFPLRTLASRWCVYGEEPDTPVWRVPPPPPLGPASGEAEQQCARFLTAPLPMQQPPREEQKVSSLAEHSGREWRSAESLNEKGKSNVTIAAVGYNVECCLEGDKDQDDDKEEEALVLHSYLQDIQHVIHCLVERLGQIRTQTLTAVSKLRQQRPHPRDERRSTASSPPLEEEGKDLSRDALFRLVAESRAAWIRQLPSWHAKLHSVSRPDSPEWTTLVFLTSLWPRYLSVGLELLQLLQKSLAFDEVGFDVLSGLGVELYYYHFYYAYYDDHSSAKEEPKTTAQQGVHSFVLSPAQGTPAPVSTLPSSRINSSSSAPAPETTTNDNIHIPTQKNSEDTPPSVFLFLSPPSTPPPLRQLVEALRRSYLLRFHLCPHEVCGTAHRHGVTQAGNARQRHITKAAKKRKEQRRQKQKPPLPQARHPQQQEERLRDDKRVQEDSVTSSRKHWHHLSSTDSPVKSPSPSVRCVSNSSSSTTFHFSTSETNQATIVWGGSLKTEDRRMRPLSSVPSSRISDSVSSTNRIATAAAAEPPSLSAFSPSSSRGGGEVSTKRTTAAALGFASLPNEKSSKRSEEDGPQLIIGGERAGSRKMRWRSVEVWPDDRGRSRANNAAVKRNAKHEVAEERLQRKKSPNPASRRGDLSHPTREMDKGHQDTKSKRSRRRGNRNKKQTETKPPEALTILKPRRQ